MAGGQRFGVEIRGALPADAAELRRLLDPAPAAAQGWAERLERVRGATGSAVLVATGWNALSGVVAVQWFETLSDPRPVARITALLVDPGDRRRGIGRLLLKAAAQAARAAGCDSLLIDIGDDPALAAFCFASGFAPVGTAMARPLRRRG